MRPSKRNLSSIELNENHGKVKVLIAILALIIITITLVIYFTNTISTAARKELSALKAGELDAAYAMTSTDFRENTSIESFKEFVEKYPILKNFQSVIFDENKTENNTGYLKGTIEGKDGEKMKIEFQLIKEGSKWKVQGIKLSRDEVSPYE